MLTRRYCTRTILLVLASILSLVLVQCALAPAPTLAPTAAPAAPGPVRGGVYTIASAVDAITLQPLLAMDGVSSWFISFIYDTLLVPDPGHKGALVPRMAESYRFSDDGLALTIALRRHLTWSDGKPLTAQDVLFTFEAKRALPAAQSLRNTFTSAEVTDPYTVVYHLARPNCVALYEANIPILPKHIFENLPITNNPHNMKPPVASGPFVLQEWVKDDHAIFAANDLYFGGRPNLDKVVMRVVKDLSVAVALFKTQEVDSTNVLPTDWDGIKQLPFARTLETDPIGLGYRFLAFNLNHPIVQDRRVRQALAYALDKQGLADAVYDGHARVTSGFVLETHWAYTDSTARYDYDVAKAKALLKEAGWTPGPDGTLAKDGKPLRLRLHYRAAAKQYEQIAVIAQEQLRSIGVSLEVIAEEWGAFMTRFTQSHDYDLVVVGYSDIDPHGAMSMYVTAGNWMGYNNPEMDRLRTEGATVPGCRPEDRQKVYAQAQRIISEDLPVVFLLTPTSLQAINTRIEIGWDDKTMTNWPIERWYIRPGR